MSDLIAWLANRWNVFVTFCKGVWDDFVEWGKDFFVTALDSFLNAVSDLTSAIPVPEFMHNGLDRLFDSLPPDILFYLAHIGIAEGLSIIGAGVLFNLTRKLLTLGQW